ncbi:MAG: hypothetical protein LJE68_06945 [Rhodobacter sp.]|nr:hypothetical protein [Rhodobacter sp.]
MTQQIRFLGSCVLLDAEGNPVAMQTRKCWALLAYLSQSQGRDVPREELAALLWPRSSESQARASLRQELAVLRRVLRQAGVAGLMTGKDRVRFEAVGGLVDTLEAERLLELEDHAAWRRAADLYRGEFLHDLNLRGGPFDEWRWLERQRLKNRLQGALQTLLTLDPAQATADMLLKVEPTQEQAWRAKMQLFEQTGRRAEALQLYQDCTEVMRRDLDADPSRETTQLADHIRAQDIAAPQQMRLVIACLTLGGAQGVSADHDPKALEQAQAWFRQQAERVIGARGGRIVPDLGDRVVAVFGYPKPAKADAENAVRAVLTLVDQPVSWSRQADLWPRAGVATSDMLVRLPAGSASDCVLAGAALVQAAAYAYQARGRQVVAGQGVCAELNQRIKVQHREDLPEGAWLVKPRRR